MVCNDSTVLVRALVEMETQSELCVDLFLPQLSSASTWLSVCLHPPADQFYVFAGGDISSTLGTSHSHMPAGLISNADPRSALILLQKTPKLSTLVGKVEKIPSVKVSMHLMLVRVT